MAHKNERRGIIRTAFDALIEARTRQAERYVNCALMMLDEDTLKSRGIDSNDLARRSLAYPA